MNNLICISIANVTMVNSTLAMIKGIIRSWQHGVNSNYLNFDHDFLSGTISFPLEQ